MGRRRRSAKNAKNHPRHIDFHIFPGKDVSPCTTDVVDSVSLRESVGDDLYYRIMQWNDSGAAEALQAALERRMARAKGKPCWVPKLKTDMYIAQVDWDKRESADAYDIPQSAGALAEELFCDRNDVTPGDRLDTQQDGQQSTFSGSQVSKPTMDKLHTIKPTGWGDVAAEAEATIFSTAMDSPTLAEAVLEDSVDGQRLLVGGRPVEPSGWDQLDTNWPQFGWDPPGLHIEARVQSGWQDAQFYPTSGFYNVYQNNSFAKDSQLGAAIKSGWKDDLWYPNRYGGFHQGHYMAAF